MVELGAAPVATQISQYTLGTLLLLLAARRFWLAGVYDASPTDKAWYRFSIWLFIWFIAACFRSLEVMSNQRAYAVISDYFWIAGYLPLLNGAYLRYGDYHSPAGKRRAVVVVILAGAMLVLLVGPLIRNPERSIIFKALDILYATFDLTALTMLIAGDTRTLSGRTLIVALVILLSSDVIFSYSIGHSFFLKFSYLAVYFLFSFAAGARLRSILFQRTAQR